MAEAKVDADGKPIVEGKSSIPAPGSAEERIAKLEKENADLLKETLSKKGQIRTMEEEKAKEQENLLKEQNKYKELYEGSLAKAKRADELEPVFTTLLEAEIASIPEDKRDLVPAFDKPEQKLLWLQNAKTKGVFGMQQEANNQGKLGKDGKPLPPASIQGKTKVGDGNLPEFVSWSRTDPRLGTLSSADYQVWKKHNSQPSSGAVGWGSR